MNRFISAILIMASLSATTACSSLKSAASSQSTESVSAMPRAVIYRTSGDCTNLVPVVLSSDGKRLVWYPDVRDIRDTSAPVAAGDGWFLDRMGVGERTVFLDYTLDQYRALDTTPSSDELIRHIKPGARVTEVIRLDMTPAQALDLIKSGTGIH